MATNTKPTKPTTNLDFNSVFATNAVSTAFTWLLADYLKGWDAIENTPPSRQQFNALQEHSDKKENFLYKQYLEGYVDKFLDYLDTVKAPINSPTFTGDPKAPTPAKSDNDTSIATTAFVRTWVDDLQSQIDDIDDEGGGGSGGSSIGIVAYSKSNPGYIKFGNGVIIQWANGYTGDAGYVTINLPISFTTMYAAAGNDAATASGNDFHIVAIDTLSSLSQVTIGGRVPGQGGTADTQISIILVGY